MAFWRFEPPKRLQIPYESEPKLGLWTRIKVTVGSTVIRKQDGDFIEFEGDYPQTLDPSAEHLHGPRGFSGSNAAFEGALRLYHGGHAYFIDDTMKAELEAAVTTQEPTGYGAYITGPLVEGSGWIGDEVALHGTNSTVQARATGVYVQLGDGEGDLR